jgi:hypothetical protein
MRKAANAAIQNSVCAHYKVKLSLSESNFKAGKLLLNPKGSSGIIAAKRN